jgi:hypothetical protein
MTIDSTYKEYSQRQEAFMQPRTTNIAPTKMREIEEKAVGKTVMSPINYTKYDI